MWVSAVFELASRAHIAQKLDSPYEVTGVAEKRRFMNAAARDVGTFLPASRERALFTA